MEEKQPVQLIVQNCPTEEDEIDLWQLWETIKKNRKTIYKVTIIVFLIALAYIFIKTPLYQAKTLMQIGYIGDKPIEKANIVAQKIKTVFYVGSPLQKKIDKEAFVDSVNPVKKVDKLIDITAYGVSNEKAVNKIKEVLNYVRKDEKLKIEHFKKDIQAQIDKTQRDIDKLKLVDIKKIDDQIILIKKQNLAQLDDKIALYQKEMVPNIEKKIEIAKKQIEKFEKNIQNLQDSIQNAQDKAFIALTLVQISNYQNMIYSRQLQINDLALQKEKILKETIPNLQRQKEKILKETIPNLQRQKEKILKIEIPKLQDNIESLRYKLTEAYISPSRFVGDIQTFDKPTKPKKKLILVVALITGLILGVFLVFFLEFLKSEPKKENE
ncbi:Wzz/FepE/Etk N-terminal domain-containing protein [Nitratiruptor sp. YY09-18]|uniref:Wzz/FepE/Etk N-terminal domain-containing protein n=1 Tax=Nitratiruptor sp. YY09-18 TaxID=2724901 RepID=UPI0019161B87|nr:Wzz/FepE/Etk N-terminal domain-containing protein [Nitratiruptor sp. YY09-18]BCD67966.1 chain length determinant protein [Nitratiruptor sp. YY09-18]